MKKFSLKSIIKEKQKVIDTISYIEQLMTKIDCQREINIHKKSIESHNEWYNKLCKMEKEEIQC